MAPPPQPSAPLRADPFLRWLLERGGLDADLYRQTSLQRRLAACLRQVRARSAEEARARIEASPALLDRALSALLIGVTEFFRDPAVFEALGEHLEGGRRRVCSLGSSGGQELYSVAMLLAEKGWLEGGTLLGIDCRAEAIAQAARGWYGAGELGGVGATRRERFFSRSDGGWSISPALREVTRWYRGWGIPEGGWDVILFRNVAIYFEAPSADRVWQGVYDALAPGGVLVTGKAERPPAFLRLDRLSACLYRR